MRKIKLPTGYLIIEQYSKGELETLSIGDYGKSKNIRAPFLGYNDEINGVPNGPIMPLSEKWVITLSTQYGCVMKCNFCDVPNVKFRGNVSTDDLKRQFLNALDCFPDVTYTDRLNVHFARMGEPLFNFQNVWEFSLWLTWSRRELQRLTNRRFEVIHPVLTTMLPSGLSERKVRQALMMWADYKNRVNHGQAGLQLSINSTYEPQRREMFQNLALSLTEIADIVTDLPPPVGRKYCLNFAVHDDTILDGNVLAKMFNPDDWMVKITPIHQTTASQQSNIKTTGGYKTFTPYKKFEQSALDAGFDTIVFIPSTDEEDGLVTCGNAILGGSELRIEQTCIDGNN